MLVVGVDLTMTFFVVSKAKLLVANAARMLTVSHHQPFWVMLSSHGQVTSAMRTIENSEVTNMSSVLSNG